MKCGGCGTTIAILDHSLGEHFCRSCGLIAEENVADYSEVYFTTEEGGKKPSGHAVNHARSYKGLGTVFPNELPTHRGIKPEQKEKTERNFSNALPALQAIWGFWRVPADLRQECAVRYRKLIENGATHGRNSYAMSIAITSVVCQEYGIARNTEEMAKTLNLSHVAVQKCLKAMAEKQG